MTSFGYEAGLALAQRPTPAAAGPVAPVPGNFSFLIYGDSRTDDGKTTSNGTSGLIQGTAMLGYAPWLEMLSGYRLRIARNANFSDNKGSDFANTHEAGIGVRSESDVQTLLDFFRARRGAAKAFRFVDPLDHSSHRMTGAPTPGDILIGTGDGVQSEFDLVKYHGVGPDAERRRITRPRAGSVRVAVDGVEPVGGWQLADKGIISFDTPPVPGSRVTAGFLFDVPVRFESDQLDMSSPAHAAGAVPHVPLIEVREA